MSVSILYQGLESATLTSTPAAAAAYPVTNINDRNKNTICKPSSAADWYVDMNMGSSLTANAIAVINHNLDTSSAAGLRLQHDDNGSYSSPTYVIGDAFLWDTIGSGDAPIYYKTFSSASDQYWRVIIDNATTSSYIGTILLGTILPLTPNPDQPRQRDHRYGVSTFETSGGQVYTNYHHGLVRGFDLKWSDITTTNKNYLVDTLWAGISGGRYPFLFVDTDSSLYYVRADMGGAMSQSESKHGLWTVGLKMEEEL